MVNKKTTALLFSFFIIASAFISRFPVLAGNDNADMIKNLANEVIAYKLAETGSQNIDEWISGALTEGAGSTSEWYAIALSQYDETADFSSYINALDAFLRSEHISSAATRQRYALAFLVCGDNSNGYIASTLEDSIGEQGIMSWVYGLHLLNNGCSSPDYDIEFIIEKILSLKLSDGGWALTGNNADIDITAMAIQALAPYYNTDDDVRAALDKAIELLSDKQLADGDFIGYGTANPESTAQVIIALTSVGIDPLTDSRFNKNGSTPFDGLLKYKLNDGSFSHTEDGRYNHTATVQAFCSLVSLWRYETGRSPLYIFESLNSSETTSTEPAVGDSSETLTDASDFRTDLTPKINAAQILSGYKIWASLIIIIAAGIVSIVFFITKKRNAKNYVFITAVALLLIIIVFFTDFKSVGDYYGDTGEKSDVIGSVTMTIRCDTIIGKEDHEYIPDDGIILPVTEFSLAKGETVYDILVEAARKYNIQIEFEGMELNNRSMAYVSGINYLYEFDFGDLSGWIYHVNGIAQSASCGNYLLSDGDVVEWLYSCELGNDLDQADPSNEAGRG